MISCDSTYTYNFRLSRCATQFSLDSQAAPAPSLTGTHLPEPSSQKEKHGHLSKELRKGQSSAGAPYLEARLHCLPLLLQTQVIPLIQCSPLCFKHALVTFHSLLPATGSSLVFAISLVKPHPALAIAAQGQPPRYCREDVHNY